MSEQPRDRYGRPLRGSFEQAVDGVPPRSQISSPDAWSEAMAHLAMDRPFHAHEVFEQRWRCCPDGERAIWKALAQWAAALTQLARGNARGASANAGKAQVNLEDADIIPEPVDLTRVRRSLAELLQ